MAGDWIKIEHTLPEKPEVFQMGEILQIDPDEVVGKLMRLWIWADNQMETGCNAASVTLSNIDRITMCPNFGFALKKVGWIEVDPDNSGAVLFKNFDRHNHQTAKVRALTNARVMKRRCNAPSVTKALPQKRREESKEPPISPKGEKKRFDGLKHFRDLTGLADPPFSILRNQTFCSAYEDWIAHRRERRPPVTKISMGLQLKWCQERGVDRAVQAINHSILRGYQGLCEPKKFGGPSLGEQTPWQQGEMIESSN